jgi:hypothetical protein
MTVVSYEMSGHLYTKKIDCGVVLTLVDLARWKAREREREREREVTRANFKSLSEMYGSYQFRIKILTYIQTQRIPMQL